MSRYKVLTDSSVWIDYFKNGNPAILDRLIREDLACINEIIFLCSAKCPKYFLICKRCFRIR